MKGRFFLLTVLAGLQLASCKKEVTTTDNGSGGGTTTPATDSFATNIKDTAFAKSVFALAALLAVRCL